MSKPRECQCYYSLIENEGDAETFVPKADYDEVKSKFAGYCGNLSKITKDRDHIRELLEESENAAEKLENGYNDLGKAYRETKKERDRYREALERIATDTLREFEWVKIARQALKADEGGE